LKLSYNSFANNGMEAPNFNQAFKVKDSGDYPHLMCIQKDTLGKA
jgi:hypothetical protein